MAHAKGGTAPYVSVFLPKVHGYDLSLCYDFMFIGKILCFLERFYALEMFMCIVFSPRFQFRFPAALNNC